MFLIKSFTFNPFQENSYVLYADSGDCIIIDPGCYQDHEKTILTNFIESEGLTPVMLVNTHCHLDHIFGNKYIAEKYNLKLKFHPDDQPVFDYAPTAGLMYDMAFDTYTGEIVYIHEGEKLKSGIDELEIIHVPGHSPGSICFYNVTQKFLIGGDVLFRNSIGRYDLPGGDGTLLISQIRSKLFLLPDEVIVYPGHGPETTIGYEKRNNPFLAT